MPDRLAEHLPGVNETTRAALFGSITDIMEYAFDDPVRQGVITGTSALPSLPSPSFPSRSIMLTAEIGRAHV